MTPFLGSTAVVRVFVSRPLRLAPVSALRFRHMGLPTRMWELRSPLRSLWQKWILRGSPLDRYTRRIIHMSKVEVVALRQSGRSTGALAPIMRVRIPPRSPLPYRLLPLQVTCPHAIACHHMRRFIHMRLF